MPENLDSLSVFSKLRGGLIVSCQALEDEPMFGAMIMAAMARAAEQGGARGIRVNGPADTMAVQSAVSLPLIGLYKDTIPDYPVYITPTVRHAVEIARAGADIIAVDATERPRPEGRNAGEYIRLVKQRTGKPVLADIATYEEGLAAARGGADAVSTTMSGYTDQSPHQEEPDFDLLARLAQALTIPVLAEGRITSPDLAAQALSLGAFAVVVGGAITRPKWITGQFVRAMRQK